MLTQVVEMTPEVIDAINGELAYIASLHTQGRADDRDHGVEGQLVTLKVYADKALVAWVESSGDDYPSPPLDVLRKIAGIAISALVKYGCPKRELPVTDADSIAQAIDAVHDGAEANDDRRAAKGDDD